MAHPCVCCTSPNRAEIDAQLVAGASLATVARTFGMNAKSVGRHRERHLSPALLAVSLEAGLTSARTAVDRIEDLAARLERALDRAETSGHAASFVGVARELRSSVELLAKLSGELRPDGPTVQVLNVLSSPDMQSVLSVLDGILTPPQRVELSGALARLGTGGQR
jgi:hypothetical protein